MPVGRVTTAFLRCVATMGDPLVSLLVVFDVTLVRCEAGDRTVGELLLVFRRAGVRVTLGPPVLDRPDAEEDDRAEGRDFTDVLLDTPELRETSLPHGELDLS